MNYFLIWLKSSEVIWIRAVMDPGSQIMIEDSISVSLVVSTACFLMGFILGQGSISYYFRFFHNSSLWLGFILTGSVWITHCGYCYLDLEFSHASSGFRCKVTKPEGHIFRVGREWCSIEMPGKEKTCLQHKFNVMFNFSFNLCSC